MSLAGVLRTLLIVGAIAALEIACRTGAIKPTMVVAPSAMVLGVIEALGDPDFWRHFGVTVEAVAVAMFIAVTGGFCIGFLLTRTPAVRRAVSPFLASYYSIPHIAFYPLLIVIFGLGRTPLIFLATMFAMVAMILATMTGLDRVPAVLAKTARVHRLGLIEEIRRVRLPAAAPHILSGLKLAVAYSFIGVIAGEFIMSTEGIGHEIAYAYDNFNNRRMYALILIVLTLVTSFNMTVFAWERRMLKRRGL